MNKIYKTFFFFIIVSLLKGQTPPGADITPNPFAKRTQVTYTILVTDTISLLIVNQLGQTLDTIAVDQLKTPGVYQDSIKLDNRPDGVYYLFIKDKIKLLSGVRLIKSGTTGIGETVNNLSVRIYPNPVADKITIEVTNASVKNSLNIMNSLGQSIYEASNLTFSHTIDVSRFPNGIYLLIFRNTSQQTLFKIVKLKE